jgi:short-chain fatty acids transporter
MAHSIRIGDALLSFDRPRIMGILNHTGLTQDLTQFLVSYSSQNLAPIFTFISAGMVNIFVPSGGGQWAIQGKIVIESASLLEVPLNKMVMAFCYGDQITNMLQPFWALPLLAITKLKASDIFPYTLLLFVVGLVIFLTALIVF